MRLNGSVVRERFDEVENGIRAAVDFLRHQIGVETLRNMPYPAMLIPLAVYFSARGTTEVVLTDSDRRRLTRWFWRSCFAERYSGQTVRVTEQDTAEVVKLKGQATNTLGDFPCEVKPEFFSGNQFRLNTAKTATFVLLLAHRMPRSFISGAKVNLSHALQAYNRHEFHHMFPTAVLPSLVPNQRNPRGQVPDFVSNVLANMCFLSRADNNKIRKRKPSEYRALMPDGPVLTEILESAVTTEVLFEDDYPGFIAQRSLLLAEAAKELIEPDLVPQVRGDQDGEL